MAGLQRETLSIPLLSVPSGLQAVRLRPLVSLLTPWPFGSLPVLTPNIFCRTGLFHVGLPQCFKDDTDHNQTFFLY